MRCLEHVTVRFLPPDESYIAWLRQHVASQRIFDVRSHACIRDNTARILMLRNPSYNGWELPSATIELGKRSPQLSVKE